MRRRRNGEGYFGYEPKRQLFRFSQSYIDPYTGLKKRKEIRAKTTRELNQKIRVWKKTIDDGLSGVSTEVTVAAFAKDYLETCRVSVKVQTYLSYKQTIEKHILPTFGMIKLKDLTPRYIQRWVTRLMDSGLAPGTIVQYRRILCTMLSQAVKFRVMAYNPASATRPPRRPNKMPPVLDRDQINTILSLARSGSFLPKPKSIDQTYYRRCFYMALLLSLSGGLRYGETFSIFWSDCVDGRLYIRHNLEQGHITDEPKTEAGLRVIPLPPNVWKELMEFKEDQLHNFGCCTGLVFCTLTGKVIQRDKFTRWWRALLSKADVPEGYRWHNNRATMATQLLAAGVPLKTVSQRLGHRTVTITLSRYAGLLEAMDSHATDVIAELVKIPEKVPDHLK